jgi:nucleoside-diphosphate-sugar epimerase
MIERWQKTTNIRCAIVRSSSVYGAGSKKPKFIYNYMEKARRSETIITHRYLNGEPALDLLHVDDFVDALARICVQKYDGLLNVGAGITTSTRVIAEMMKREIGSASQIEQTQIEAHTACIAMNYQKANRILGWRPQITLCDGLKRLLIEKL